MGTRLTAAALLLHLFSEPVHSNRFSTRAGSFFTVTAIILVLRWSVVAQLVR